MYSTPTPVTPSAIARGTARAASRTSPLTCSADSIPKKANIRSSPDAPRRESDGNDPNARFSARTGDRPNTTNAMSGSTFATVATPLTRDPSAAPRMLTIARLVITAMRSTARSTLPPRPGASPREASANTVETAHIASVTPSQSSTPHRYPAYGPNAASTYAYGPPLWGTRLPASAMQRATSVVATAHTR